MKSYFSDLVFGAAMFFLGFSLATVSEYDAIGSGSLVSFNIAKYECEKSGDECVMIWEFVPVKKEKSK